MKTPARCNQAGSENACKTKHTSPIGDNATRSEMKELQDAMHRAGKLLDEALSEARGVEFTNEELELMEDTIARLRGTLSLIETTVSGSEATIDWDDELKRLA